MENKQKNITLLIDGQRYPLKINEKDEQRYCDAAILIDKALDYYRNC